MSNVFAGPDAIHDAWIGCPAWLDRKLPGRYVVGYESGAEMEAATAQGFMPVGPFRVWQRQSRTERYRFRRRTG